MTRWLKKHFFQIFNSIWGTWTHFDLWKYWLYPFHGTAKLLKMQKITCKNHRILYGSFKHLRYVGGFATKLQKNGLVIMNWHTFFFLGGKKWCHIGIRVKKTAGLRLFSAKTWLLVRSENIDNQINHFEKEHHLASLHHFGFDLLVFRSATKNCLFRVFKGITTQFCEIMIKHYKDPY